MIQVLFYGRMSGHTNIIDLVSEKNEPIKKGLIKFGKRNQMDGGLKISARDLVRSSKSLADILF